MMNRHFIFALCTVLGFSVSGISMAQSVPTDKEAAAKAINDAKKSVAEKDRDGSIGEANAHRDQRVQVAQADSEAIKGENAAKMEVAMSNAARREKEAEALKIATSAEKIQAARALEEAYAAEQQADGTVAHAHPGKIALCIGNQNAMDAPQGDLHQGIEPGRSFHCVASCVKYQAVSRSTTSP